MKIKIFVIAVVVLLANFLSAQAQSSATKNAANKNWDNFWAKFSQTVKTKNRKEFIALTSKDFMSGGGETIQEWLEQVTWRELTNSVNKGTKPYSFQDRQVWRITKDNNLLFVFEKGRWRFFGQLIA